MPAAALSLLLVSSCSMTPDYSRPTVALPAHYPSDAATGAPQEAVRSDWRDFFAEPELRALIARAIANNADLRVASARLEQAQAGVAARGADLLPQANASGGMAKLGLPDNLSPFVGKNTLTSYNGLLQASWELDFFGRLRSLRAAAYEHYIESGEAKRAITISLVARVAAAYLADREYAERLALARDTLANRQESLRMLTRRYQVGSGSRLEVTQAETLRTQAAGEIQALELARMQNIDALGVLVGAPVAAADFHRDLSQVGLDQPVPAGLPSDLLANRPDILAAEHDLRASYADIGAARAAFFPSIALTGTAGTASDALGGLFDGGTGLWLFRPTVTLPIFTGGKLHANLRMTQGQRDEALANYQKIVQSAFRDVADALAQRRWLAAQIGTAEQAIAALKERAGLARLRYDAGRSAYLEVLDAERDLFSAQEQLIELRRAWLASGVALYAAIGGGLATDEYAAAERGS